ncbi:hypothetical protein QBC32DRAFT_335617 [Pseudoneurospora amorphoporcata]|uniref:Uncharacterized protein n=1 Tax=Pseudoneurospora amorphoporcata TaxID=241081 RepID=A0AAN6NZD9_9PEZI|nr:hypothetical protein QBC32DRAFT_335617 [Pseudoneurospora amorphoporcata]
MSQLAKVKSKAREPPSLFLPPSPSASHASLSATTGPGPGHQSGPGPSSSIGPGRGGTSLLPSPAVNDTRRASVAAAAAAAAAAANAATTTTGSTSPNPATALNLSIPLQLPRGESTRTTDRTDALWAEMQATLEEVELSAGGGTRVFGPDHEQKLAELRQAQIALAQAWARSEADDAVETQKNGGAASVVGAGLGKTKSSVAGTEYGGLGGRSEAGGTIGGTEGGGPRSTGGAGSTRPNSAGGPEKLGAKLEQETDADILLARKRREANDRYFSRVNQGVLDVVAKLEDVAVAMRAVEQESKDIWADGEDNSNPGSVRANV